MNVFMNVLMNGRLLSFLAESIGMPLLLEEEGERKNTCPVLRRVAYGRKYPNLVHRRMLAANPSVNPATHWSGCLGMNLRVMSGPRKNVSSE